MTIARTLRAGVALLSIVLTAIALALPLAAHAAAPAIGQPAPSFNLPNVATGSSVSLASLIQGKKATVILFIATRCPVSNAYNDRMEALAEKYTARGIAFAAINSNVSESPAECAAHAKDHKFTFAVLKDAGNVVADQYDASRTPEVFVVDDKGALVYHGRIDSNQDESEVKTHDLANALDNILAGKPVSPSETKAFGCSIKRAH